MNILQGIQISKNSSVDELVGILIKVSPTSLIEFEEPTLLNIGETATWMIACHLEIPANDDKDMVIRTIWSSAPSTFTIEDVQRYALLETMRYCGAVLVDDAVSLENIEVQPEPEPITERQRFKNLKTRLGIKKNEELNEHVHNFSAGTLESIRDINSTNIKEFNDYLLEVLSNIESV